MKSRFVALVFVLFLLPALAYAQNGCVPNSQSTVFNASHDLNEVSDEANLKPNEPNIDSTPRLNAAIDYVSRHSACRELTLDSGSYSFRTPITVGGRQTYLHIPSGSNVSFDFKNAQFFFKESVFSAFIVENCSACTIQNLSIDYVHLPFTELAVTKVSEQGQFILAAPLNASWPNPQQLYKHQAAALGPKNPIGSFVGFDTRGGIPQYGDTDWPISPDLTEPHRIALPPDHVIEPGDVFIVAARGGGPAIYAKNDSATTFKNIVIYTSGGPAIESWYSAGMAFLRITIEPGSDRLVSTVAGGIQLNDMTGPGNRVQNCLIDGTQDDSIAGNLDTQIAWVDVLSTTAVTLRAPWSSGNLFFINSMTGASVGGPPNPGRTLGAKWPVYKLDPALTPNEVTLIDQGLSGYALSTAQFTYPHFVVVAQNQIKNSYLARGVAFSGVGGIQITGNTITNTQQAGIFVGTSLPEYGPVYKVLIGDNTLTATNMGMTGVGTDMLGAIEVMSFGSGGEKNGGNVFGGQSNRKVFINRNTITTTERSGIWVGNAADGEVDSTNVITQYNLSHGNLGLMPHLNDGLSPYASIAFKRAVFGWCNGNVPGLTLELCHPPSEP
jgi:hypothetical protein